VVLPLAEGLALLGGHARVSPVFVVEENGGKVRIIHDLSAAAGEEPSVNESTDFASAPAVTCGLVWKSVLQELWQLRQRELEGRIVGSKMDVKAAFRQALADLRGVVLCYVFDGVLVIDLRLQFGWRSSPGWWQVFGEALAWSVGQDAPGCGPAPSAEAVAAAAHVRVVPEAPGAVRAAVPRDEAAARSGPLRGGPGEPPIATIYVDDLIFFMLAYSEAACLAVTAGAAHDHLMLLGLPGPEHELVCPRKKMTDWDSILVVLGWLVNTDAMTVSLTAERLTQLRELVSQWLARARTNARVRKQDLWRLLGKLQWASLVVRGSRAFIWRVVQMLGGRNALLKGGGKVRCGGLVGDLEYWEWALGEEARVVGVPIGALVRRRPDRCWFSDASYMAIGGLCSATGVWWRYDLTSEQRARLVRSVRVTGQLVADGWLHINLLELVGMVMTAWVVIVACGGRPRVGGEVVLLRGDNTAAVQWIRRRGGASDERSRAALRLLAAVEMGGGWSFDALHVRGVHNKLADAITRLPDCVAVQRYLETEAPRAEGEAPWHQRVLGGRELRLLGQLLAKHTALGASERTHWVLISGCGYCGAGFGR
jgi:hypothetical protein